MVRISALQLSGLDAEWSSKSERGPTKLRDGEEVGAPGADGAAGPGRCGGIAGWRPGNQRHRNQ